MRFKLQLFHFSTGKIAKSVGTKLCKIGSRSTLHGDLETSINDALFKRIKGFKIKQLNKRIDIKKQIEAEENVGRYEL